MFFTIFPHFYIKGKHSMLILHYNMHIRDVFYEASEAKPALQASVLQSQISTLSSDPRDHLWSFPETGPYRTRRFAREQLCYMKTSHFI